MILFIQTYFSSFSTIIHFFLFNEISSVQKLLKSVNISFEIYSFSACCQWINQFYIVVIRLIIGYLK